MLKFDENAIGEICLFEPGTPSIRIRTSPLMRLTHSGESVESHTKAVAYTMTAVNFPHSPAFRNNILAEQPTIRRNKLHGSVLVRNLGFEKRVSIHYTTDKWQSVIGDMECRFDGVISQSSNHFVGVDRFRYSLPLDELAADISETPVVLEFAVRFQTTGNEFWDNNSGSNYFVQINPPAIVPSMLETIDSRSAGSPVSDDPASSVLPKPILKKSHSTGELPSLMTHNGSPFKLSAAPRRGRVFPACPISTDTPSRPPSNTRIAGSPHQDAIPLAIPTSGNSIPSSFLSNHHSPLSAAFLSYGSSPLSSSAIQMSIISPPAAFGPISFIPTAAVCCSLLLSGTTTHSSHSPKKSPSCTTTPLSSPSRTHFNGLDNPYYFDHSCSPPMSAMLSSY